jgi:outer membrane translocation and assembly module TamA
MKMEKARLIDEARNGMDAEVFLRSDFGRFLLERAKNEVFESLCSLKECDPYDGKKIQDLQLRIWAMERFEGWVFGALMDGKNAVDELERIDSEEKDGF